MKIQTEKQVIADRCSIHLSYGKIASWEITLEVTGMDLETAGPDDKRGVKITGRPWLSKGKMQDPVAFGRYLQEVGRSLCLAAEEARRLAPTTEEEKL